MACRLKVHVQVRTHQSTTVNSWFSPSALWAPGIKLMRSDWAANAFVLWAMLQNPFLSQCFEMYHLISPFFFLPFDLYFLGGSHPHCMCSCTYRWTWSSWCWEWSSITLSSSLSPKLTSLQLANLLWASPASALTMLESGGLPCSPRSCMGSEGVNSGFHTSASSTDPSPHFTSFLLVFCVCLFGLVEVGAHYTALTGLELAVLIKLALNLWFSCFSL